jgi:hypothetical protein
LCGFFDFDSLNTNKNTNNGRRLGYFSDWGVGICSHRRFTIGRARAKPAPWA